MIDLTNDFVIKFPDLEPTPENKQWLERKLPTLGSWACSNERYLDIDTEYDIADDFEEPADILCYFHKERRIGLLR